MAELTKKLHLKKNTTEHLAKAYSTTAEAGAEYITNKIDGVTAYIPIGATNDSEATIGRAKKPSGAEKAILTMGKPPYTEKSWTTAGTYTFTVPQGVTRIRVAVCGGGGGCASTAEDDNDTRSVEAGNGGTSSFGSLISATGGGGGYALINAGNEYEGGYWQNPSATGGSGGTPNGASGDFSTSTQYSTINTSGGAGHSLSFSNTKGDYGKGGYASGKNDNGAAAIGSGGGGGYNSAYFNVSAGTTYSITVGNAGSNNDDYFEGGTRTSYPAKAGFVLIAFGGNI